MAVLSSSWLLDIVVTVALVPLIYFVKFKLHSRYFWRRRNIPYAEPTFLMGNLGGAGTTRTFATIMHDVYSQHPASPVVGMWFFTRPMVVVKDLSLVKNVLVKDFQHFHDRGIKFDKVHEPLSGNLINMDGVKWRNLRVKLTPAFTSGKLKTMFPLMEECGLEFEKYLFDFAKNEETVEFKDFLARLNTDLIGSCAFGIETNSIRNPDAEFRVYGRKVFKPTPWIFISGILMNIWPEVNKVVTLRQFPTDVSKFFMRVVKETVSYREANNVQRKDFMDLLIQLKNKGYIEKADTETEEVAVEGPAGDPFTMNALAAQAFVFFAAGFETASTLMMFVLYELALNPDLRRKVQAEIDEATRRHGGKRTYEAMQELDLMDRCLQESLRKYAGMPMIMRECTKDYKVPGTDLVIEKGVGVIIPLSCFHMDPKYFPDPETFDPDRFLPEEKARRDHYAYLPFGEGPRICIGNRFALLQSKIGLTSILSTYDIHIAPTTEVPVQLDPTSFFPATRNGMPLKITLREPR